jgi:hypothetical protein
VAIVSSSYLHVITLAGDPFCRRVGGDVGPVVPVVTTMLEIILWLVGVYLVVGLLWAAVVVFLSAGLRLPFTLLDFANYVFLWPRDAWVNFGPPR